MNAWLQIIIQINFFTFSINNHSCYDQYTLYIWTRQDETVSAILRIILVNDEGKYFLENSH